MQLNKSSLSPAPTQMYLISAEDFRQKELIESCLYMRYFDIERGRYNRQKQTPAGSSSRFHIFSHISLIWLKTFYALLRLFLIEFFIYQYFFT